jgi:hypothetical protein
MTYSDIVTQRAVEAITQSAEAWAKLRANNAALTAERDDLQADVRRLQAWGEGLAREKAELRAENVRLKVDHRIVQLLTRLIRATRPIRVKEDDYDEPS